MGRYLLIGAGFSRNWGGPLSEEITGSLLGELHDDLEIARTLRRGPFEDAFQGFQPPTAAHSADAKLTRFQNAVIGLFSRLNKSFRTKNFEFNNDLGFSVKDFLAKFDAIFSLNQDLLLEIHYIQTFGLGAKWSGVVLPGMTCALPASHTGLLDPTLCKWTPTGNTVGGSGLQPLYKLHGSSNWLTDSGEPLLIMGNAKTGSIQRFPVLRSYHNEFAARLSEDNSKLMVIGYSFQDEHINAVIERAWREHELGTYLVDLRGREALLDPKMSSAAIKVKRDIEEIKLIGELRRPLSSVFAGDTFAHGEFNPVLFVIRTPGATTNFIVGSLPRGVGGAPTATSRRTKKRCMRLRRVGIGSSRPKCAAIAWLPYYRARKSDHCLASAGLFFCPPCYNPRRS